MLIRSFDIACDNFDKIEITQTNRTNVVDAAENAIFENFKNVIKTHEKSSSSPSGFSVFVSPNRTRPTSSFDAVKICRKMKILNFKFTNLSAQNPLNAILRQIEKTFSFYICRLFHVFADVKKN